MLIHALDKEQSGRANNGSGARKSARQSSTPGKACQAGRLGLRGEGRAPADFMGLAAGQKAWKNLTT